MRLAVLCSMRLQASLHCKFTPLHVSVQRPGFTCAAPCRDCAAEAALSVHTTQTLRNMCRVEEQSTLSRWMVASIAACASVARRLIMTARAGRAALCAAYASEPEAARKTPCRSAASAPDTPCTRLLKPCRRCLQATHSGEGWEAGPQGQGPAPDVQRLCVLLAGSPAPPLV